MTVWLKIELTVVNDGLNEYDGTGPRDPVMASGLEPQL